MSSNLKKELTVKDLITTGIFSALFAVVTMVGGSYICIKSSINIFIASSSGMDYRTSIFGFSY
jgi:hypothetical protein